MATIDRAETQQYRAASDGIYVCHCLQVTEAEVLTALDCAAVETLKELRDCTGAGDGCTACHRRLLAYIAEHRQDKRNAVAS